jgi:HAD superfamily hydrolase (TIGR01490 family)
METDMHLALFDLDNTLLPIDSDYEWSRFLARLGVLDGDDYERENNRFYEQYKAGSLDIAEFLQFQLAPLAAHPRDTLDRWHARFMAEVVMPTITDQARELVDRHRERGDLIALVTATNAFVTAPIARAFGIDHLVATTLEEADGQFTGRPKGTPSFREGKIVRTHEWLGSIGQRFDGFERCVERQQINGIEGGAFTGDRDIGIQCVRLLLPAALVTVLGTGVIDEHATHRHGGEGQCLRIVLDLRLGLGRELHEGFVHERGGLERVASAFLLEQCCGTHAEFIVQERESVID